MTKPVAKSHWYILGITAIVFAWSAYHPHDYFTWFLEVIPAVVGFIVIVATYRRFRLSTFMYACIAIHAIILMVGGKYTYAEVPLFNWLRDIGIFSRNNYDKIGHLAQGIFPAIYAREILLRNAVLKPGGWLNFIIISICGAISAVYEILEWWIGAASGSAGDSFLGTQGYIWDTQSDMFLCFVGAAIAVVLFSKVHDRFLKFD